jgi:hypothetical protein
MIDINIYFFPKGLKDGTYSLYMLKGDSQFFGFFSDFLVATYEGKIFSFGK